MNPRGKSQRRMNPATTALPRKDCKSERTGEGSRIDPALRGSPGIHARAGLNPIAHAPLNASPRDFMEEVLWNSGFSRVVPSRGARLEVGAPWSFPEAPVGRRRQREAA